MAAYRFSVIEERLRELWQSAGFESLAELARRAGIREGTAQKHVERGSIPAKAAVAYISAARSTGADVNWLLTGTGRPPTKVSALPVHRIIDRKQVVMPQSPSAAVLQPLDALGNSAAQPVPVFETRPVAGGQHFMYRDIPIGRIPRPAFHSPEADLFAIYLQSDDMEPRYERGDRLLINRSLPLVPGKDVILLSDKDEEGRQRAIIRRLVRIQADGYEVRRYNPAENEHAPLAMWPFAYYVEAARWR